jgi:regulator of replication initiation timing
MRSIPFSRTRAVLFALLVFPTLLIAQSQADLKSIMERLDRLERENTILKAEVEKLRSRVGEPETETAPTVVERVEIAEKRVEELAQTKVESSQKFPIKLTGMALFNLFYNTRHSGGYDDPLAASQAGGRIASGASFRQSIIGLEYTGSKTLFGGKAGGSLFMDFYDGLVEGSTLPLRLRTANFHVDWETRTISVGYEKAIFNPRSPNSYMTVGVGPLWASGNLWRWQPQVKFEQRFHAGDSTKFTAQGGFLQTYEDAGVSSALASSVQERRPSLEGRFEVDQRLWGDRRIAFAPGFHVSTSHVGGSSIPSHIFSMDWLVNPFEKFEITGAFFSGINVAHLGGLRQGIVLRPDGVPIGVHAQGGWAQTSYRATNRLTLNLFAGTEDARNSELLRGNIGRNLSGGGNLMYRLAPNVVMSFETMQWRTSYIGLGTRLNNRYDLALVYLF